MQFSLPSSVPIYPDPAVPGVAAAGPVAAAVPAATAADASTDTFEQYLPKEEVADKDQPETETADIGKMAAILVASYWMPVVPPQPVAPAPVGADPTVAGAVETAAETVGQAPVASASTVSVNLPQGKAGKCAPAIPTLAVTDAETAADTSAPVAEVAAAPVKVKVPAGKPADEFKAHGKMAVAMPAAAPTAVEAEPMQSPPTALENALPTDPTCPASPDSKPTVVPANAGAVATVTAPVVEATPPPATRRPLAGAGRAGERAATVGSRSVGAPSVSTTAVAPDTAMPDSVSPAAATELRPTVKGAGPAWEKTAAAQLYGAENSSNANSAQEKDFLKALHVSVTAAASGVGTGVAKVTAIMAAVLPNRSKSGSAAEPALLGATTAGKLPALEFSVEAPAPVATLRETLNAVVSAVDALERSAKAGQNSVDLQFHVGSERLALRVELRDGTVHTTFHTDSSELRTALAREWQSVVQPAGARDTRLADPVFSSTSSGGNDASFSSAGQGTPHQRQQAMQDPIAAFRTGEFSDLAAVEPTVANPATSTVNSLLNAFA